MSAVAPPPRKVARRAPPADRLIRTGRPRTSNGDAFGQSVSGESSEPLMDLPLFPLHLVLCPGVALPLHVFEPRYRELVERCLLGPAPYLVGEVTELDEVLGHADRARLLAVRVNRQFIRYVELLRAGDDEDGPELTVSIDSAGELELPTPRGQIARRGQRGAR